MKLQFTLPGRGVEEEKKRITEVLEQEGGGGVSGDPEEAEDGGVLRALTGEVELEEGQEEEEHEDEDEHEEAGQKQEEQEIVEEEGPAARASDAISMCFLCGKSFPSRKSLYGHMRCHPEREWRGINPPPGAKIRGVPPTGSSQNDANSMNAHPSSGPAASPLWSWSTTEKRGRKGTKHHSPVRSVCFLWNEDPMANAVCSLLHIAEGGCNHDLMEPRMLTDVSVDEGEVVSDDGLPSNAGDADDLELGTMETLEDVDQLEASNGGINGADSEGQDQDAPDKKRKRKIKELETLQESKLAGRNRYRCTTCNQCFPNHQALGGHRARRHKKEKRAPEEESAGDDGEAAAPPPNMEPPPATLHVVVPKAPALAEHRCDKCSMVFPTGQALGGHKRKHWNGHESSAAATLPPKANAQRLPLPAGSVSSSSEQPKEITVKRYCWPGYGDPAAGMPKQVNVIRQRFAETEASATPMLEEIDEQTRHDFDPEKPSGASAEDENGQRQGSENNQEAAASATKGSCVQMALGKMHDFDLNERPQDGQEEEY